MRDDRGTSTRPGEKGLVIIDEGIECGFCGKGCLLEFGDDPGKYLDPSYLPSM